jgi:GTP cyclohydrolase I
VQDLIRRLLIELGEDPDREGWRDPARVEQALRFLTGGYDANIDEASTGRCSPLIITRWSSSRTSTSTPSASIICCRFFGKCHVAYIPSKRVIGLSKIPRSSMCSRAGCQIQERNDEQIAETIREKIDPLGVAVVCEGTHLCMSIARSRKAELVCHHQRDDRRLPRERADADGVPRPHQTAGLTATGTVPSPGLACID